MILLISVFCLILFTIFAKHHGSAQPRISGGSRVPLKKFPSFAKIDTTEWSCSGVLISEPGSSFSSCFVLTAAHCILSNDSTESFINGDVSLGRRLVNGVESFKNRIKIEAVAIPAGFDPTLSPTDLHRDDVALIKLIKPAYFKRSVVEPIKRATYSDMEHYVENMTCSFAGMGLTGVDNSASPYLLEAKVRTVDIEHKCGFKTITDGRQICVTNFQENIGGCVGDSGGPLYCKINETDLLFGILSSGNGCFDTTPIGIYQLQQIYANVAAYSTWITNAMNFMKKNTFSSGQIII